MDGGFGSDRALFVEYGSGVLFLLWKEIFQLSEVTVTLSFLNDTKEKRLLLDVLRRLSKVSCTRKGEICVSYLNKTNYLP